MAMAVPSKAELESRAAIWNICVGAARIYQSNEDKILNAAKLLFGTCAQESLFKYRRQIGRDGVPIPISSQLGGYSLFQLEPASVGLWLQRLNMEQPLLVLTNKFCNTRLANTPRLAILREMVQGQNADRLGACACRDHYYRVPEAIPSGVDAQASYWKKYYNTWKGKGTTEQYLKHWHDLCLPALRYLEVER